MIHTDQRNPVQTMPAYSADTELLTRHGWLTFNQVTNAHDVATRTPDGYFQWQRPNRIRWEPYTGEMVWFHSRTVDLLVTPDQAILNRPRVRRWVDGTLTELPRRDHVTAAGDVGGTDHRVLVATSQWKPVTAKTEITLVSPPVRADGSRNVGQPPQEFTANASDFAAFMGMFLSEGYIGSTRTGDYPIYITQTQKGNGFRQYQELLNRITGREIPWRPGSNGSWCFRNKALYGYLEACGKYAWGKRIPREILDLNAEHLETFWHYYWLGDGATMRSKGRKDIEVIQTTSRDIADAFQEVLQKLGTWSIVHRTDGVTNKFGRRTIYRVLRRAGDIAFATHIERTSYQGMTGSVAVPNGAIYVRRNNHPVWAGSSSLS